MYYIGAYAKVSVTGGVTTTNTYYQAGLMQVENQGSTLYYLINDDLGSASVTLTATGNAQSSQLPVRWITKVLRYWTKLVSPP
jgi:hypothetical protein